MLKLLFVSLVSVSLNALAAQSYLKCNELDLNGDFINNNFIVNELVSLDSVSFGSYYQVPDDIYQIRYFPESSVLNGLQYDAHGGWLKNKIEQVIEYDKMVLISQNFGCLLTY